MDISLAPGHYVIAVSGGVDSVVLLDLLRQLPDVTLTVAHFDHGIRPDSMQDERFVRRLAASHGLPYVFQRVALGPDASEAAARHARYDFLHSARHAAGAQAVITAHHRDDVLETAIHNIIRGTGRRGLSSLRSTDDIRRPLLHVPKSEIHAYAQSHTLTWREDTTNASDTYARNYIRHNVLNRFDHQHRQRLVKIIRLAARQNEQIDQLLDQTVATMCHQNVMSRTDFVKLPHAVAIEVMASWLRKNGIENIDTKMLERLTHAAKTLKPAAQVHVNQKRLMDIGKHDLALRTMER